MTVNTNLLENINFSIVLQRAPNVEFFGKGVSLPSINISSVAQPTPFSVIKQQGDHITFSPLDVTFRVDEEMANWSEIFNWMTSIGFPESHEQYGRPNIKAQNTLTSDIELIIFSSKNNPKHSFTFKDAWPSDISSIIIDIDQDGVIYSEVTVTFEYDTYSKTAI